MTHHTLTVGGFGDKVTALVRLVEANGRTIVFTRTREGACPLAKALTEKGVDTVDLHGNLSQQVRERNLARFSSGAAQAVVATDVAARGIHVDDVAAGHPLRPRRATPSPTSTAAAVRRVPAPTAWSSP